MQTQKIRVDFHRGPGCYTIGKYDADIKINARFDIEVPVEHDETGRRVNVLKYVTPLIDGFCDDVRTTMAFRRTNAMGASSGPTEQEAELYRSGEPKAPTS